PAAADRCADEAARVARVWGPTRRAQVTQALVATGKAYAPVAAVRAGDALDRWAGGWRDLRESSCRDAERGTLAGPAWRTIAACLDDGLADVQSRVDLLAAGGDAVARAAEIADAPSPRACGQVGVDPL